MNPNFIGTSWTIAVETEKQVYHEGAMYRNKDIVKLLPSDLNSYNPDLTLIARRDNPAVPSYDGTNIDNVNWSLLGGMGYGLIGYKEILTVGAGTYTPASNVQSFYAELIGGGGGGGSSSAGGAGGSGYPTTFLINQITHKSDGGNGGGSSSSAGSGGGAGGGGGSGGSGGATGGGFWF